MTNSRFIHRIKLILTLVLFIGLLSSCVNTRNAVYLDNIGDTRMAITLDDLEPVIQKNDLLSITVSSPNPTATQIFNLPNVTGNEATGYLVSQDGFIDFPMLGRINAAGLTKKQLKDTITTSITKSQLLTDPVVAIRYLNYKVTVLGEVAKPTVINVTSEKVSLLEALGFAGDMTVYAKRNNVMVIREEAGQRIVKRINLNSKELFTSPYYYLKSNDIVYVEPNKARVASASTSRVWLPTVMSAMALAATIIYRYSR